MIQAQKIKKNEITAKIFLFAVLLLAPQLAAAGPIEDGLNWVMTLLTSGIARTVAIIAVAFMGYMAWAGKLTWEVTIKALIGIVFVFGGASIVDTFIGAVS